MKNGKAKGFALLIGVFFVISGCGGPNSEQPPERAPAQVRGHRPERRRVRQRAQQPEQFPISRSVSIAGEELRSKISQRRRIRL